MNLKLVRPTIEYADQVMQYKEAMIRNGDSLDGCAGLEDVKIFPSGLNLKAD